jgi:hypothetical protein
VRIIMPADGPVPSHWEIHVFAAGEPRRGLFRLFPPATRAELWGGLALIVLSILGDAGVIKCRSQAPALERDAVTVEGRVLRLWITTGKGSGLQVAYEYLPPTDSEARTIQGETKIDNEHFVRLKEGGSVAVRVCRTDPSNHQVLGEPPRVLASAAAFTFTIGLLALPALAGVVNLWWWWISGRKSVQTQIFVLDDKNVS